MLQSLLKIWYLNEGGSLLLELNRVLRPGGYFVWSATPVYQKLEEDVQIWKGRFDKHIQTPKQILQMYTFLMNHIQ